MAEPTLNERKPSRYFSQHLSTVVALPTSKRGRPSMRDSRYMGTQVRHAINQVFTGLGGWEGMMAWAKDNPDVFYGHVVPKLLPKLTDEDRAAGIRVVIYSQPANSMTQVSEVVDLSSTSTPQPVVIGTATTEDSETDHE